MPRRFVIKPGGNEPGPDGEGICLFSVCMPGEGARRGGVALPMPESISSQTSKGIIHKKFTYTHNQSHLTIFVFFVG